MAHHDDLENASIDVAVADNEKLNHNFTHSSSKSEDNGETSELHRGLKSRHVTMIALGGALGTGLLIGTGQALTKTGPAGVFIDYSVIGVVVFMVMSALGEMITHMPLAHGFGGYASRFVDPALGFATGYSYWLKYILATPNQLTAAGLIMKFWVGDRVSPGVFIAIFLVVIIAINYFGIKAFGEFEFWLSSIKVIVIVAIILLCLILACGGGPNHHASGFQYWSNPGAFATYKHKGSLGKFIGLWSAMIQAVYAFLGTELVGVTVGETQNPRRAMPKAIKLTFYRILFFYILSVFFLGMVVPYNSPLLAFAANASTSAAASPFLVAVTIAKINGLDHVINACLLIFVFSAANSDLYIASRTMYGLAIDNKAPRIFAKTNNSGVPVVSLGVSASFCLLAFMSVNQQATVVFGYLTNVVTVFGMLTWINILVTHICFRRACTAQNVPLATLAYRAPFGSAGSVGALLFLSILILTKGLTVFIGKFDYKNFVVQYIGLPVYLAMILGYKLVYKTKYVPPKAVDLWTGTQVFRDEETRVRLQDSGKQKTWYDRFVSWLF